MSLPELLPMFGVAAALVAALVGWARLSGDRAEQAVKTSGMNLEQMRVLRDETIEAHQECRKETARLLGRLKDASGMERTLHNEIDHLERVIKRLEREAGT